MPTHNKNLKNISGGSLNDALFMYIHLKSPKSRDTVPVNSTFIQHLQRIDQNTTDQDTTHSKLNPQVFTISKHGLHRSWVA
jgi:hypothetical protein